MENSLESPQITVPPRDSEALARAIHRLLDDSSLRHRLAENAFQQVREMTWRNTALQTLAVYAKAMNNSETVATIKEKHLLHR